MRRELLRNGLHLFALSGVAIAQPLYGLIESDPSILVAGDVTGGALLVFALVLLLAPPLACLAIEALVALPAPRSVGVVHLGFVGALVALFVSQLRVDVGLLPASTVLLAPIALAAGVAAAWSYRRTSRARTFLSLLACAPIVFLALFLFTGRAAPLLTVDTAPNATFPDSGARAPVVFLVLDELPLSSLLDARGRIDAARYPSFARLADQSTWFRDTTAVEAFTPWAVPAILDGRWPEPQRFANVGFHPDNLFTLLGRTHALDVHEVITRLCPMSLCPRKKGSAVARGFGVYADLVGPSWRRLLPGGAPAQLAADATQTLRELLGATPRGIETGSRPEGAELERLISERDATFESFLNALRPSQRSGLHYLHLLYPHAPFDQRAEGSYTLIGNRLRDDVWDADPHLAQLGLRRHLLQVQHTDLLLGRVLDRLHETGLYDRSAIVVVADHGAAFMPGTSRRQPMPGTLSSLMPVPFLLKAPQQRTAHVDDRPARTIDVLPTVADAIGARLDFAVDGRSLLRKGQGPDRANPTMTVQGYPGPELLGSGTRLWDTASRARLTVGGTGGDLRPLFAAEGFAGLIGRAVPPGLPRDTALAAALEPHSGPLAIQATITGGPVPDVVAVVRCGLIVGVARTYSEADEIRVAALLAPAARVGCPTEFVVVEDGRPFRKLDVLAR